MSRNNGKRKYPSYTLDDVQKAVEAVKGKQLTYRASQEKYGVPQSVIYNRISGRKKYLEKTGGGRCAVLSPEAENEIIKRFLNHRAEGYLCDKKELRNTVAQYVTRNNLKTPFNRNRPGEAWYKNFRERHPTLVIDGAPPLQKYRNENHADKSKRVETEQGPETVKSNHNDSESGSYSEANKIVARGLKEALLGEQNSRSEAPEIKVEDIGFSAEGETRGSGNSEVNVADSDIKVEVPEIQIEDPEIKVEVPEIKIEDPEIKIEDPEINVEVPEIKIEDPEIKVEDLDESQFSKLIFEITEYDENESKDIAMLPAPPNVTE